MNLIRCLSVSPDARTRTFAVNRHLLETPSEHHYREKQSGWEEVQSPPIEYAVTNRLFDLPAVEEVRIRRQEVDVTIGGAYDWPSELDAVVAVLGTHVFANEPVVFEMQSDHVIKRFAHGLEVTVTWGLSIGYECVSVSSAENVRRTTGDKRYLSILCSMFAYAGVASATLTPHQLKLSIKPSYSVETVAQAAVEAIRNNVFGGGPVPVIDAAAGS